jgi:hypothetical protein
MTEEQKSGGDVLAELQALGQQLSTAVKALWESEESRKLRGEIGDGFVELGRQVETAVQSAQESDAAKQFGEQVKETVDKARESDLASKLEEGLLNGLRELNEEMSKLVRSFERQETTPPEPESEKEA